MMPPLMFTQDEIEALVLDSRWAKAYGDDALTTSARQALIEICAISLEIHRLHRVYDVK